MKHCIVQDTWDDEDDQELREYLEHLDGVNVRYMSEEDILQQVPNVDTMIFADSSVVQDLLLKHSTNKTFIVESYPENMNHLYKRKILKTTMKKSNDDDCIPALPYFCKLQGSNKDVVASVVRTRDDHSMLSETLKNDDEPVYICDVVDFQCEFRLFCSPENVVAIREYTKYIMGHRQANADESANHDLQVKKVDQIPQDFVKQVFEASKQLPG